MINSMIVSRRDDIINSVKNSIDDTTQLFIESSLENIFNSINEYKIFSVLYLDIQALDININKFDEKKHLVKEIKNLLPQIKIIIIAPLEQTKHAVDFIKAGAFNYLTEPIFNEEVSLVLSEAYSDLRKDEELKYLRDEFWHAEFTNIIKTNSPLMKKVFEKVRAVAQTKSTVLLTGETGTGKGVIAKLIHFHSHRKNSPYISVHCGSIPDTLIESELFGYEKGSFTGASKRKLGKFEIANTGTIFLDEIGTITANTQIKLLQVLQDRYLQRVGGSYDISVDIRILSATNENLKELAELGKFRKDLYYRLNVFPIEIPPLRNRTEDIEHIVNTILNRLNSEHLKDISSVHPDVIEAFKSYSWPGNVRELENVLERAYILETGKTLQPEKFPEEIFGLPKIIQIKQSNVFIPFSEAKKRAVESFEKEYLLKLLTENSGKINIAAEKAGFTSRYLRELMDKYKLDKKDFRN